jgi:hypothetical protein
MRTISAQKKAGQAAKEEWNRKGRKGMKGCRGFYSIPSVIFIVVLFGKRACARS